MFILNPIVAILHNTKTNRYHPVFFAESPLPGPHYDGKPIRHKSKMHHTTGLDTREEALVYIDSSPTIKEHMPNLKKCLDTDIEWDGEGIPAMSYIFNDEGTKIL